VYILHEWRANFHTLAGEIGHKEVHEKGQGKRLHNRSLDIASERLGLYGKVDLVEDKSDSVYPVEYKKGKLGEWLNDKIQLCAQALVLEEELQKDVSYGYIFYVSSHRRKKVEFTSDLSERTKRTIREISALVAQAIAPKPHYIYKRCSPCSIQPICLPWEVEKLNSC